MEQPSAKGRDERTGRFLPGWQGGPGNPFAGQVARLRAAMLEAIAPDDLHAIVRALIKRARGGDVAAAREVFDRTLGRPAAGPLLDHADAHAIAAVLEVIRLHSDVRLRAWVTPDTYERQELEAALPVEGVGAADRRSY